MSSGEANPRHVRPEMVSSAVSFLSDPKVHSSTVSQRISFLESKGLSPDEIDEALRQTGTSGAITAGAAAPHSGPSYSIYPQQQQQPYAPVYYGAQHQHPPQQHDRDWRDWFIMAVVSGTVGYGIIQLARKYLMPHLQPPNQTILESDRDELTAKYDEVAAQLAALDGETKAVKAGLEQQREAVERGIKDVEEAVKVMRDNDKRRNDDMDAVKSEVDSMKDQLPMMFEKTREAQAASLADLQNELKSLKALLNSSRGAAGSSRPMYGIGAGAGAGAGGAASPGAYAGSSSTPTHEQGRASPSLGGKPSIPAWQLAPDAAGTSSPSPSNEGSLGAAPSADEPKGTSTADAGAEHAKDASSSTPAAEGYSVPT